MLSVVSASPTPSERPQPERDHPRHVDDEHQADQAPALAVGGGPRLAEREPASDGGRLRDVGDHPGDEQQPDLQQEHAAEQREEGDRDAELVVGGGRVLARGVVGSAHRERDQRRDQHRDQHRHRRHDHRRADGRLRVEPDDPERGVVDVTELQRPQRHGARLVGGAEHSRRRLPRRRAAPRPEPVRVPADPPSIATAPTARPAEGRPAAVVRPGAGRTGGPTFLRPPTMSGSATKSSCQVRRAGPGPRHRCDGREAPASPPSRAAGCQAPSCPVPAPRSARERDAAASVWSRPPCLPRCSGCSGRFPGCARLDY